MNWILWLLLLLGGTAAAGWWFGEKYIHDKRHAKPVTEQSVPIERSGHTGEQDAGQDSEHEPVKRRSPIIYKRGH